MHLYFISRGIKQNRDLFVKFMETQMFMWKRKDLKTGEEKLDGVQGALRPVELWEYVFPEEVLPEVLGMMHIDPKDADKYGALDQSMQTKVLRKMLGAKKIPEDTPVIGNTHYVFLDGMALHVLGIKEDPKVDVPKWGVNQELL